MGCPEIGELLGGFLEGSCTTFYEALNQLQAVCETSYIKQQKMRKSNQKYYSKEDVLIERREIIMALVTFFFSYIFLFHC